jgi:hypothetical protein
LSCGGVESKTQRKTGEPHQQPQIQKATSKIEIKRKSRKMHSATNDFEKRALQMFED